MHVSMQVFLPQCHINSGGKYRRSREKAEVKRGEGKLGGRAEAKQETREGWKEKKNRMQKFNITQTEMLIKEKLC